MELGVTGVSVGFVIVFSIFVVAFVGLLVYVAVWAIRRDSEGRKRWQARRSEAADPPTQT